MQRAGSFSVDTTSKGEEHMAHHGIRNMLHFSYQKTTDEILEKVGTKAEAVKAKIAEREQRIRDLRKAHDISDQDLIQIFSQAAQATREGQSRMSYSISSNSVGTVAAHPGSGSSGAATEERLIGAGVVQNFLSESNLIETEKADLKKLESIKRNLRPLIHHSSDTGAGYVESYVSMTEEDLEYLGF